MSNATRVTLVNNGKHTLKISGFAEWQPGERKTVTSSEAAYLLGNSNVAKREKPKTSKPKSTK